VNEAVSPLLDLVDVRRAVVAALGEGDTAAYRHPLGFVHLALPGDGGRKHRLHFWTAEAESVEQGQIHDHAFHFCSFVVAGAVEHRPHDVRDVFSHRDATHRVCTVVQTGSETRLLPGPRLVAATPRPPETYRAGECYAFDGGRFHASANAFAGRSITFLQARKVTDASSSVLSSDLTASAMSWRKSWLGPHCVSALLEETLAELAVLECTAARRGR